jgi:low temperature requirement protein LtrA
MATWIELFYDLVYVAALLIFSSAASHLGIFSGTLWIVLVFAASWWVWFTTSVCANRFHMTDFAHRFLLLFQMLVIVLMAMESRVSVTGHSTLLCAEFGLLLATLAVMHVRAARRHTSDRSYARRLAAMSGAGAVVFLATVPMPEPWRLGVAGVAFGALVAGALFSLRFLARLSATDEDHLVERMGLFTLIVCGEAFIEVAVTASHETITGIDVVSLIFEFVLVFALFTSYFEDIPAAGLNQRRLALWAVAHLVAQIGVAGTGVGASKLVDLNSSVRLPHTEILKLMVPLAVTFLALAVVGACTRRRPWRPLAAARTAAAGAAVVVGVVCWALPFVHVAEALPLFCAVAVVNAVAVVRLRSQTSVEPAAISGTSTA